MLPKEIISSACTHSLLFLPVIHVSATYQNARTNNLLGKCNTKEFVLGNQTNLQFIYFYEDNNLLQTILLTSLSSKVKSTVLCLRLVSKTFIKLERFKFICCRSRKLHTLAGTKVGLPVPGLPVACCPASSPGPLSSLATLSAFTSHKDWDQVSVYSNRSLSRPRMYHMERQGPTIFY